MEDVLSIDSTSNFSSMAEPPSHLEAQYSPLVPVFQDHGATLPHRGSPDSNSEAMVNALRALQDKIRGLELERAAAARKFQDLAEETDRHTRSTQTPLPTTTSSHSSPPPYASPFGRDTEGRESSLTEELRARLDSIDTKLSQQAGTLEGLRHVVEQTESSQRRLLGPYTGQRGREGLDRGVSRQRMESSHLGTSAQTGDTEAKVRRLEVEHARLASGQTLTQGKLRDLEQRLLVDQWHRKQLQSSTAKGTDVDRGVPNTRSGRQKAPSKRRKKVTRRSCQCTCGRTIGVGGEGEGPVCRCQPVPGIHYRLNLKDVPFIIGTSTTPSHSVPANCQQLLASMKAHSPLLCGAVAASRGYGGPRKKAARPLVSQAELKTLLASLEEEFGHLTFEHQELAGRAQQPGDPAQASADPERQLENLKELVETKREQIEIVQKQLSGCRNKPPPKPCPFRHPPLPPRALQSVGAGSGLSAGSGSSAVPKSPSLDFLQKMKSLQSTLQRDDLSWD